MKKICHLTCRFIYLFSVTPNFSSRTRAARNTFLICPNWWRGSFILRKAVCYTVCLSLCIEVWPDCFHIWLEIHVPRCAVKGQYRLLHCLHDFNTDWQTEIDTDWPASLYLSVFVSLHVIHLGFLKSVHSCKSATDIWGYWRYRTILLLLLNLNWNWSRDNATVAIVMGRSNLQSLRVLIESLLWTRGGGKTTTETGIENKRDGPAKLCLWLVF